ncbi:MAG TPA: tetratricopeptide repeat protein, partial [Cyclobacteriaceae bacterium]|nr:tetratricopeptide repeat protein [Cyclobacteriaceae bacterium]
AFAYEDVQVDSIQLRKADSLYFSSHWKAASHLYSKITKQTSDAMLLQRLAFCHQMLHQFKEAEEYYRQSLTNHPQPFLKTYTTFRLAQTFALDHKKDSALRRLHSLADTGFLSFQAIDTASAFKLIASAEEIKAVRDKIFANAYPCSANAKYRQFDFWEGTWDVYLTGTPTLVGKSKIEKADGGCDILEDFTSTNLPYSGHSISYYNPNTDGWEQVYVGSSGGGQQNYFGGAFVDGAMRFKFKNPVLKTEGRFLFFKIGPDEVRQMIEISYDGGKTHSIGYDYTYKRR